MRLRVVDLGLVSPVRSQSVYHAVGYAFHRETPPTILLVSTTSPYVSIGFHQDAEREVDLTYCQREGLPVIRREVGGGAVYLDHNQVFTQWIFPRDLVPLRLEERFAWYVRPLIETYRQWGIDATWRPINDIHVRGRKIGGTGAASIGEAEILVGSLMLDFDTQRMSRVLKVASEKMRDKLFESLEEYMTTMRRELGTLPDRDAVVHTYLECCAAWLGAELEVGSLTPDEEAIAAELDERFASEEWLYQKGGLRQPGITIQADVRLHEAALKVPGGLIRVIVRTHRGRIDDVSISGDFTLLPALGLAAIEQALRGLRARREELAARVREVYRALGLQSPGVSADDFAAAVMLALESRS
ncbi:lipoate--protein ligase [Thermomicrobium sp. 4228-Ro]|uniref:lipoate--protein ligase n=1 Tax=Thermomicrobium sp. 4228-Ro TaxID=2993937 RepID=UPI002248ED12|nr:lipoate--protein ligase [Thermomicrobium sp. 4228-Ro]MCX2726786.1 lipoate--protein ligase [Thermomicrobium sp. 4228-Ro]